ncbi:response regulator [Methylotenera sp. N17]|jgi:DNA-binding NarL/FixJ family response regulator|uniref:response regulator n=1 Tax=Methylotenera sp. N17 TaxID=1502761 RepID=UPI00064634AE|nr:response regulator [Methylotenera sp. N17]
MMRVLLVEDSRLLRESIIEMLKVCEHVSIDDYATNKEDAIQLLDTKQYDFMIADIELAQGNGFEVVKHTMNPDYAFKAPLTLMLTNHANGYYKSLARQLGVKYFYDKSMDFETAIQTIENESKYFV